MKAYSTTRRKGAIKRIFMRFAAPFYSVFLTQYGKRKINYMVRTFPLNRDKLSEKERL